MSMTNPNHPLNAHPVAQPMSDDYMTKREHFALMLLPSLIQSGVFQGANPTAADAMMAVHWANALIDALNQYEQSVIDGTPIAPPNAPSEG